MQLKQVVPTSLLQTALSKKVFTVGDMDADEEPIAAEYLGYNSANNQVVYTVNDTTNTAARALILD